MCAVTIFAGNVRLLASRDTPGQLRMEGMLERDIMMARQAIDRLNFLLMRNLLRVEPSVAGDADEFLVWRGIQDGIIDEERNLSPVYLFRQRMVAMTSKAVVLVPQGKCGMSEERW